MNSVWEKNRRPRPTVGAGRTLPGHGPTPRPGPLLARSSLRCSRGCRARLRRMPGLAIDAGATGGAALVVGEDGGVLARGYREFAQLFPRPGWVEHEPDDIWTATLAACRQALAGTDEQPTCIGITDQRETAVVWDRRTLHSPRPAIVWQDRRTTAICDRLRSDGVEELVTELTGLRLDPYFTGTKYAWLAEHEPRLWTGVRDGALALGTVDSYVIARLT